jgi:hypothetical protein
MSEVTMGQLASRFTVAASKLGPVSDQKLNTLAQVGVGIVKSEIQDMHAVDTGTMLNSTQAEKSGKSTWLVGPTVFYAPYVALGTSRMGARPFHLTAARKLNEQVGDLFTAEDLGL